MVAEVSTDPLEELSSLLKARLGALEAKTHLTPAEAEALYDLCYQQAVQGRHQDALTHFTILVSFKPSEVKYLQGLAYVQQALKRFDEAMAVYHMLDLLDPKNPRYTLSMAECLLQQEQFGPACDLLRDVIDFCETRDVQDPLLARARMLYQLVRKGDPHASQL